VGYEFLPLFFVRYILIIHTSRRNGSILGEEEALKKTISIVLLCIWIPFLSAQNNRPRNRNDVIYLLNYIATEACLTEQYKEDSLLLEEIYRRLESRVDPGWIDTASKNQMINLFNGITDFRTQDIRRQGIHYMRDHAKARAIKSAIPSPVFFLSLTNNIKNPLALLVNIAGMAAQSVTSYLSATERAEMQFYEKNLELKIEQIRALNRLTSTMFGYRQTTATANGLTENDTVSPDSIRKFLAIKKYAPALRLQTLKSSENQHIYEKYYPYWLELANTSHGLGQYQECISAIERYEAIRSPLFMAYNDIEYSLSLCKGIDSLSNIYRNNPGIYIPRCLEYLRKIDQNVPVDEWSIRFTAALAYMDLASVSTNASDKAAYLNSAYQLFYGNLVNNLAARQIEMMKQYMNPIVTPANADQEQKKVYDELKKKRGKQLPPADEAFYTNYHALIGLMEQLKKSQQERDTLNAALGEATALVRARDEYCRLTAEGYDFININPNRDFHFNPFNPISKWDDYFEIPFLFLTDNAKLSIEASITGQPMYREENTQFEVGSIGFYLGSARWQFGIPSSYSDINKWAAVCGINLESKLKKAKTWTPDYIDFIISDTVGVYRVRYIYIPGEGPLTLSAVTKEQ